VAILKRWIGGGTVLQTCSALNYSLVRPAPCTFAAADAAKQNFGSVTQRTLLNLLVLLPLPYLHSFTITVPSGLIRTGTATDIRVLIEKTRI